MAYFERVGCMQFDPVDVAGISPEISLCARVEGFTRQTLDGLLYKRRALMDVWDKNACIALAGDFCTLMAMRGDRGWRVRNRADYTPAVESVVAALRESGPLSSAAFPEPERREALERLLLGAEIVIHHRVGRRRFYANASDTVPGIAPPREFTSDEERLDWRVERRVGAAGLMQGGATDFLGIGGYGAAERAASFERLLGAGKLILVNVDGIAKPLYMRASDAESLNVSDDFPLRAAFLGPLDNMLWNRKLVEKLFGFSYRWEIYTPPGAREYAPYTLPVLYGDSFIGRISLKREKAALFIDNFWPEEGVKPGKRMIAAVNAALAAHARMLSLQPGGGL